MESGLILDVEPRRIKLLQRDYTRNAPSSQSAGTSSLDTLATEGINPRTRDLDGLDVESALCLMNDEDALVPAAVRAEIPAIARAVVLAEASLRAGGRLIYVGAGTSGRLGCLDAAEIPPTFGMEPGVIIGVIAGGDRALRSSVEGAEDAPEAGGAALAELEVSERDTVIGITASGRTPFVVGALAEARRCGAHTVGLANHRPSELEAHADVMIAPMVGPEAISGSTRLKSGTSQKLVLNMISTLTMVRLGKTYGNLMVDLRPSNEKLRQRARRLVVQVVGCSREEADRLLAAAGGRAKTAMLMGLAGLDAANAETQLEAAGGRLREALERARGAAP
jgi:N-acetylmuramic acid 6-phosphate etherase